MNNIGVLSNIAGAGISVSSATGNVTIVNTGVTSIIAGTGVIVSGPNGAVTISSTGTSVINTHLVTTGTYTATASDDYIGVNSTVPVTITLPTGVNGTMYIIKEEHGIGFGIITVQGTGGQTIDGLPTALIGISHSSITLVFRGTEWHIV